jgi:predicted kinase
MNTMKKLYLVRGISGAGKSSFSKSISNAMTGHVEADMFFVDDEGNYNFDANKLKEAHEWCKKETETFMGPNGFDVVIVSNTFTQEWEMEPYFELAKKYGYIVFTIIVENRHGGVNQHGVPEKTIQAMKDRFQIKL